MFRLNLQQIIIYVLIYLWDRSIFVTFYLNFYYFFFVNEKAHNCFRHIQSKSKGFDFYKKSRLLLLNGTSSSFWVVAFAQYEALLNKSLLEKVSIKTERINIEPLILAPMQRIKTWKWKSVIRWHALYTNLY